ncbi:TetR/AcrR family transcriptional regulator [Cryobacterium sp. Y50]|uniref:TetR/AcrR family transcriptional regulator n=1 Tax=Cryobacterium sp. Y50 TaxID=2048286 RepID=UPI000CE50F0D|nr:TetR/AcrR family transcriptional regulator [Cryobacterium sp. Y50]
MGRLQTFDESVVVQSARDLFWAKGYEGASLADLETATGLGRSSLYHAFGSKRGLFDAAVSDYMQTVIRPRLAGLRVGATDASALLAYYDGLTVATAGLPNGSPRTGCLLVNCAAGLAAHDDAARAVVDGYRAELSDALRDALVHASSGAGTDPNQFDDRVRTLASLSMSAMLVARVNRIEAIALLNAASNLIRVWLPDGCG